MTRDEFEDIVREYGRACSEETACFEYGSSVHSAQAEQRERMAEILAEFDRLSVIAHEHDVDAAIQESAAEFNRSCERIEIQDAAAIERSARK